MQGWGLQNHAVKAVLIATTSGMCVESLGMQQQLVAWVCLLCVDPGMADILKILKIHVENPF